MDAEADEVIGECEEAPPVKRKLTLRRSIVVKKNLKSLQDSQHKKKLAQASFYNGNENVSPMLREGKAPVHQRLGATEPQEPQRRRIILRRVQRENGRNNNKRMNKRRQFVPQNGIITRKYRYNAQQRLTAIRNSFQNYSTTGNKKIILRRPRPVNYQIRIPNTEPMRHSVKASIDPQIQEDIRILIEQSPAVPNTIPNVALAVTASTNVSMHERFSSYP